MSYIIGAIWLFGLAAAIFVIWAGDRLLRDQAEAHAAGFNSILDHAIHKGIERGIARALAGDETSKPNCLQCEEHGSPFDGPCANCGHIWQKGDWS